MLNRNRNFDLLPNPNLLLSKRPNILPKTKLLPKTEASANHRSFCEKPNINGHYTAFKTKLYLNFQLFDFKVWIFPHKYPVNWILLGQFSSLATKTTEASAVNRTFCPSRTFCKNRRSGLFCQRISAEASTEDHRQSFCRTQLRVNTASYTEFLLVYLYKMTV